MANKEPKPSDEVRTTGHEWDGIEEWNNPLPKWWLYTFYACVIWAIGYWIVYPAWPTVSSYTKGYLGYSQRAQVNKDIATAKDVSTNTRIRMKSSNLSISDLYKTVR